MSSRKDAEAAEEHYGAVYSVSGPVIVAENMLGCAMYELVGFIEFAAIVEA
jgi:vacuolar-type H+-ATPase catalytic subunit A/Vma1